jgi:hypothetical protein
MMMIVPKMIFMILLMVRVRVRVRLRVRVSDISILTREGV